MDSRFRGNDKRKAENGKNSPPVMPAEAGIQNLDYRP